MRLVLVVLALTLPATAGATLVQFRTPSANIGCVSSSDPGLGGPYLRCDILSGLKPKPAKPRGCNLDWGFGFELHATGSAKTVCAGDTAVDRRAKVLRYGPEVVAQRLHVPSQASRACAARTAAATASSSAAAHSCRF